MSGRRPRRPAAAASPTSQRARKRPRTSAVTTTAEAATAPADQGERDLFARVAANSELLQKSIGANVELTKEVALLVGQVSQRANSTVGTAGVSRLEPGSTTATPGDTSVHAAGAGGDGAQSAMGVIDEAVDSLTTERARKRLVSAATPLHSGVPAKIRGRYGLTNLSIFRFFPDVRPLPNPCESWHPVARISPSRCLAGRQRRISRCRSGCLPGINFQRSI